VSRAGATQRFGVVFKDGSLEVDEAETGLHRARLVEDCEVKEERTKC
jgi:hypothetical protein